MKRLICKLCLIALLASGMFLVERSSFAAPKTSDGGPTEALLPHEAMRAWQSGAGSVYETLRNRGQMAAAMTELERLAKDGDIWGQAVLGTHLIHGDGVARDAQAAIVWLRSAAAHDNTWALNALAVARLTGDGVPIDPQAGLTYLERAARGGSAVAMFNLATSYAHGEIVEQDIPKALMWTTLAGATAGDYYTDGHPPLFWKSYEGSIQMMMQLGFLDDEEPFQAPEGLRARFETLRAMTGRSSYTTPVEIWAGAFLCDLAPVGVMLSFEPGNTNAANAHPVTLHVFPSPHRPDMSGCLTGWLSVVRKEGPDGPAAFAWAPGSWIEKPRNLDLSAGAFGTFVLDDLWAHGVVLDSHCGDLLLQRVLARPIEPREACRSPGAEAGKPSVPSATMRANQR